MMSLQDDEILAEEDDLNDLKKNLQSKSFSSYTNEIQFSCEKNLFILHPQ